MNWNCKWCSFLNHADLIICEICEEKKVALNINNQFSKSSVTNNTNDEKDIFDLLISSMSSSKIHFRLCSFPVDYYTQRNSFGSTWSCGYRNIQMICSSLQRNSLYRHSLFNGDGRVPGIEEIQCWIERAWKAGFDIQGAGQFGYSLVGGNSWIGATECATLLRFFGVRARIVDFVGDNLSDRPLQNFCSLDSYFTSTKVGEKRSLDQNSSVLPNKRNGISGAGTKLLEWVSEYFKTGDEQSSFVPPVYLQHDGHSRTIVGFTSSTDRAAEVESCLVFDPACSGQLLQQNLSDDVHGRSSAKWHRQVKKARHSFNKDQYQIVCIDEGLMSETERERSKVVDAVCITSD